MYEPYFKSRDSVRCPRCYLEYKPNGLVAPAPYTLYETCRFCGYIYNIECKYLLDSSKKNIIGKVFISPPIVRPSNL